MNKNDLTELQKLHQEQMREKREAIKRRKQRTRRLIIRGAIAENAISGSTDMTDEQFQDTLIRTVRRSEAMGASHPQDSIGRSPRESPAEAPAEQPSAERASSHLM